ncbi:MAG TPA: hypothetical protein VL043_04605 [Protaetiibacter sp.]|nr:hypothetical protein [Protaetiibacter sp.]
MQLGTVQGGMQLAEPAASAWIALVEQVRRETGVTLTITYPAGAWRSEEVVLDMWRNPKKYGATHGTAKPRSLGGPGSIHENGLCVDIWNWAALSTKRLDELAARHGFRRTITAEPWHYQHNGTTPAGGDTTPFDPDESEEDDMTPRVIRRTGTSTDEWMLVAPHLVGPTAKERGYLVTVDRSVGVAWARLYARGDGGEHARVDRDGYNAIQAQARVLHEQWKAAQPTGSGGPTAAEVADELAERLKA